MVECLRGALVVMCVIGVAAAAAAASAAASSTPEGFQTGFLTLLDNMIKNMENLELMDGVTFVKTSEMTPRTLNSDFGMLLLDRINSFINTHAVRVDLGEPDVEGRGKKKKLLKAGKKYLLPLILGIKAKMALLSGLVGHTIAIIAAKAILVSKIALILGLMLFLKKLVSHPPKEIEHAHIKHRKIVLPSDDLEVHRRDSGWQKQASEEDMNDDLDHHSDHERRGHAHEMAYRRQRPVH